MSRDRETIRRHTKALSVVDSLAWIGVLAAMDEAIDLVSRAAGENEAAKSGS